MLFTNIIWKYIKNFLSRSRSLEVVVVGQAGQQHQIVTKNIIIGIYEYIYN